MKTNKRGASDRASQGRGRERKNKRKKDFPTADLLPMNRNNPVFFFFLLSKLAKGHEAAMRAATTV